MGFLGAWHGAAAILLPAFTRMFQLPSRGLGPGKIISFEVRRTWNSCPAAYQAQALGTKALSFWAPTSLICRMGTTPFRSRG